LEAQLKLLIEANWLTAVRTHGHEDNCRGEKSEGQSHCLHATVPEQLQEKKKMMRDDRNTMFTR
jgi:hypothetical protein